MRTFPHFNPAGGECPVCGTNVDGETILIPIAGTEEGNNVQAIQVHADCIEANWFYSSKQRFIGVLTKVMRDDDPQVQDAVFRAAMNPVPNPPYLKATTGELLQEIRSDLADGEYRSSIIRKIDAAIARHEGKQP